MGHRGKFALFGLSACDRRLLGSRCSSRGLQPQGIRLPSARRVLNQGMVTANLGV